MSLSKLISSVVFAAAVPALAQADATPCSLGQYAPSSAAPYAQQYVSDFGDFSVLQGAQLYVPAQPGLTREWLQHDVTRALASCQLPARHVKIDVVSAGAGFWVLLTGADEREGAELVRWAGALVPQPTAAHR